jgi:DNA polymerase
VQDWIYVVGDWETYYNTAEKYSLRVMDPAQYILDPRFEEIGGGFKINGQATGWIDGPDVGRFLGSLGDPSRICFIAHNVLFDACIAAWRHGWVAGFYVDTLALSRALLGHVLARNDLASVARYLGLGEKGTTVHKVNGMRRQHIIQAGFYNEYAAYSCLDSDLCWGVFQKLAPMMPQSELVLNDMIHRMAIEPQLRFDPPVLHEHLGQVQADKEMALTRAGLDLSTKEAREESIGRLMSNDKFAELLISMGVTPPTKTSLTTGEETYAFAKTDDGMKELLEHPDIAVQTIVSARLGVKSTIEETRTQRFIGVSQLEFPKLGRNWAPVPLKPSGAHTHRLSGDWRWNMQNLSRPSLKRPRAMLRESIVAPEGKSIVAADESQVELRGAMMFCGQTDMVEALRRGEDVYSKNGTKWFGFPVSKATVGPRFCAKTGTLSCQFQVGWRKYQASVKHLSLEQIGQQVLLSNIEAQRHVQIFRTDNYQVAGMWKYLQNVVIPAMTRPETDFMVGPVRVLHERILLPNGMDLKYRGLFRDRNGDWHFWYGNRLKKLYGGKLLENIIQALCRIITMDVALRVKDIFAKNYLARLAMQAHDELAYVCPDECAPYVKQILETEMRREPDWWPGIPLNCEAGIGKCYGKAK